MRIGEVLAATRAELILPTDAVPGNLLRAAHCEAAEDTGPIGKASRVPDGDVWEI